MKAKPRAEIFERAWTAQEWGALPIATSADVAELVLMAKGLGSLGDAPEPSSTTRRRCSSSPTTEPSIFGSPKLGWAISSTRYGTGRRRTARLWHVRS